MLELGQPQVGHGDEVLAGPEPSGCALGVLHQPVHRLHKRVAAPLLHPRDHPLQVRAERARQPLERLQARAPRPANPALQARSGHRLTVTVRRRLVHLAQRHLHAPGPCVLQIRALQRIHRLHVPLAPARVVRAHRPAQAAPTGAIQLTQRSGHSAWAGFELRHTHLVHGLARRGCHMKAVVANGRLGQLLLSPIEVGRTHIHAHMADGLGVATVLGQVLGERLHRLVIAPFGGKEQAILLQVVHDGDVLMAFAHTGLIGADVAHAAHVVLLASDLDVVLDAPPQGLGIGAQMACGMGHGQFLAQAERKGLKQQGEAAALARPGHGYLAGLATGAAGHGGNVSVQPGLELEEVQVAPGAAHAFVDALVHRAAVRAGHAPLGADHIEVDASLGGAELGAFYTPGRLQPKGCGKQGFGAQAHGVTGRRLQEESKSLQCPTPSASHHALVLRVKFHAKRH